MLLLPRIERQEVHTALTTAWEARGTRCSYHGSRGKSYMLLLARIERQEVHAALTTDWEARGTHTLLLVLHGSRGKEVHTRWLLPRIERQEVHADLTTDREAKRYTLALSTDREVIATRCSYHGSRGKSYMLLLPRIERQEVHAALITDGEARGTHTLALATDREAKRYTLALTTDREARGTNTLALTTDREASGLSAVVFVRHLRP